MCTILATAIQQISMPEQLPLSNQMELIQNTQGLPVPYSTFVLSLLPSTIADFRLRIAVLCLTGH
jgi:hypothetical protein